MGLYDVAHGGGIRNINTVFVVYDEDLDKACRKLSWHIASELCFRSECTIEFIERLYYKNDVFDVSTNIEKIKSKKIFETQIVGTPYFRKVREDAIIKDKQKQTEADVAEYLLLKERVTEWRILNEL